MIGVPRGSMAIALCVFACSRKEPGLEGAQAALGAKTQEASAAPRSQPAILPASRITSSSAQGPSVGYTFVASNLTDGSLGTSWQPAKNAKGPHWVRLEFDNEVAVTGVAIANGFQTRDRFGDEFLLNRRIATGRLRFDGANEVPVHFEADARGYVRFDIPQKVTRSVELIVDETYAGSKWNDLAISEVEVTGVVNRGPSVPKAQVANAIVAEPADSNAAPSAAPSAPSEWWTPPPGGREQVEALAHGFAGIDENDLGTVFTSDLKPIYGAPNLFEQKPPRRVPRDAMQHVVVKLRQSSQFETGFNYLFVKAGVSYNDEHDYQVVRAMQVREVVRVDDSARLRPPPAEAVFYLAEVHRGASFDVLIEGDHSSMGTRLEVALSVGGAFNHLRESGSYRLKAFGLGLRDLAGDGIFAMTSDQIMERYRTGEPVPVQLVFRTIPGRAYNPKELPMPELVLDEPGFRVKESGYRAWTLPAGRYRVEATSRPNGMNLAWFGDVTCDHQVASNREYQSVKMNCTVVDAKVELQLSNPSTFDLGPEEIMSLYISRLR